MIGFAERSSDTRLLTFEVAGQAYALPIEGILEVGETGNLCGVPTLSRSDSAVMNWHGDALPLVSARLLVDAPAEESDQAESAADPLATEQVLVLSDGVGESPCLGLPIDAVLGIVVGSNRPPRATSDVVVERRPIDGRVVGVLDPQRLVTRAKEVIEGLAA